MTCADTIFVVCPARPDRLFPGFHQVVGNRFFDTDTEAREFIDSLPEPSRAYFQVFSLGMQVIGATALPQRPSRKPSSRLVQYRYQLCNGCLKEEIADSREDCPYCGSTELACYTTLKREPL